MAITSYNSISGEPIDFNRLLDPTLKQRVIDFLGDSRHCTDIIINEINSGYYNQFISPSDREFLDLGANIGLFSFYVSTQAKRIIAAEPFSEHYDILLALSTALQEEGKPIVSLRCGFNSMKVAVGGEDKEGVAFYNHSPNPTMNGLNHSGDSQFSEAERVNVVSLNSILRFYEANNTAIDFAKIDIEGAEYEAFEKVDKELLKKWCKKMLVECHNNSRANRDDTTSFVESVLTSAGFSVTRVNGSTLFANVN